MSAQISSATEVWNDDEGNSGCVVSGEATDTTGATALLDADADVSGSFFVSPTSSPDLLAANLPYFFG